MAENAPTEEHLQPSQDIPPEQMAAEQRRASFAGFIGTTLENYDMVVYSIGSAVIFSTLFFPNVSPLIGLIASFGAYAVGFAARPLGSLVFSHYGETLGRKFVMVATLFLMGAATFAIGLLPTYTQVGILAPILLVVLRFAQGFGAGAEMAGGVVLLTEFAPRRRRGLASSLVWAGAAVGSVMGALVWAAIQLLPDEALHQWGWRLPFLSSILVTVAAYIIRRRMKESPVFSEVKEARKQASSPIKTVLAEGRRPLSRVFFMNMGTSAHSYIYQVFFGAYLIAQGIVEPSLVPQMLLVGGVVGVPAALAAGWATDRWGRRPVATAIMLVLFAIPIPAFLLMNTGHVLVIAMVFAVVFAFGVQGAIASQSAMFAELFGAQYRYAGVAIGREFSSIPGGGLAPMICSALLAWASGSFWPVAIYMMLMAAISLITIVRSPETRGRDLLDTRNAERDQACDAKEHVPA